MRKNLLKQLTMALLLTIAVPTLNAQVAHVGDILCEGNLTVSPASFNASTYIPIGVVFYVDNTGQHGWAVALQDAGDYQWGCFESDTPLPNYENTRQAIQDLDGYNNTLIVRQHSEDHPAFYAVDFEHGWYVSAIGQLNYLYGNIAEVNAGLAAAGGSVFSSTNEWRYWSSTEFSGNNVWTLHSSGEFHYPGTYSNDKYRSWRVRGVRNF